MIAVDTNVLFYAHDSRDRRKQEIAADLIISLINEGVLLWQVACEYLWASRKRESQGYSYKEALADIQGLRRAWQTVLPAWDVLDRMESLKSKSRLLALGCPADWDVSGVWSPHAVFRGFRGMPWRRHP